MSKGRRRELSQFSLALIAGLVVTLATGTALAEQPNVYHRNLMKGQVVAQLQGQALVCIDNEFSAQVGEEFVVFGKKRVRSRHGAKYRNKLRMRA